MQTCCGPPHAEFDWAGTSRDAGERKSRMFVFVSVKLLIEIAIKPFELKNKFYIVGCGKMCSCAAAFSFISASRGGATTEC